MIIQNISSQGTLPVRPVSNDGPAVAVPQTAAAASVTQPPSAEQLNNAINKINSAMQQSNQSLEFAVDPGTKTPVVKMMDTTTGKVVSQFPSEAVLGIAESIDQYLNTHKLQQGILLKQQA
ncbi:hypothetical protein MIZ01_0516 [Sideroxyarcus emersonii]|uniref:Flagellar protein FlaG n=1 Tax=Sideroxyarcus emersonii TaxID=2764705 RepID=A0AAN1X895_9PROT|nr:flagellar protein FlaG [Sideroxyarcus emersonii]BCK86750.1 hypothetical protein MIZ01_0516 [Sideroxyarcus emersonii]